MRRAVRAEASFKGTSLRALGHLLYADRRSHMRQISYAVTLALLWVGWAAAQPIVDNGDGTVTDTHTGLQWEKKTGTAGGFVDCSMTTCSDPHDVSNVYQWSQSGTAPDGGAFTDFLVKLNSGGCFASQCDWRLPTLDELQGILLAPYPCGSDPCIDPTFGPTQSNPYWTSTTNPSIPSFAWFVYFNDGLVTNAGKIYTRWVRAVRSLPTPTPTPTPEAACPGSCHVELQTEDGQKDIEKYLKTLFAELRKCARKVDTTCPCPTPKAHALVVKAKLTSACAAQLSCQANRSLGAVFGTNWNVNNACYAGGGQSKCEATAAAAVAKVSVKRFERNRAGRTKKSVNDTNSCIAKIARRCGQDQWSAAVCAAATNTYQAVAVPGVCEETSGSYTVDQVNAAGGAALTSLIADGVPVTPATWTDGLFLEAYIRTAHELGCHVALPYPSPSSEGGGGATLRAANSTDTPCGLPVAAYSGAINFCGDGNFTMPEGLAGDCLNRVCHDHDLCYYNQCEAGCIKKVDGSGVLGCTWTPVRKPCDDTFHNEFVQCYGSGYLSCGFSCVFTDFIATTIQTLQTDNSTCESCPTGSCSAGCCTTAESCAPSATPTTTPTSTPTATATPTVTATSSATRTATNTPTNPSSGPSSTPTRTPTSTVTRTITPTNTRTATATNTPATPVTTTFSAGTGDGFVSNSGNSPSLYGSVHDAASGDTADYFSSSMTVGQSGSAISVFVARVFLPFNTAALPDTASIQSAQLCFTGSGFDNSTTDFFITVVQASQASPTQLQLSDYSQCGAVTGATSGGSLFTGSFNANGQNCITLNATALGWINRSGWTLLGLRSDRDINRIAPSTGEDVGLRTADGGAAATLTVTYQ